MPTLIRTARSFLRVCFPKRPAEPLLETKERLWFQTRQWALETQQKWSQPGGSRSDAGMVPEGVLALPSERLPACMPLNMTDRMKPQAMHVHHATAANFERQKQLAIDSLQWGSLSRDPYVLRESPGKGLGIFATRPMEPGDLVLQETAVLCADPDAAHPVQHMRDMLGRLLMMPDEVTIAVLALSRPSSLDTMSLFLNARANLDLALGTNGDMGLRDLQQARKLVCHLKDHLSVLVGESDQLRRQLRAMKIINPRWDSPSMQVLAMREKMRHLEAKISSASAVFHHHNRALTRLRRAAMGFRNSRFTNQIIANMRGRDAKQRTKRAQTTEELSQIFARNSFCAPAPAGSSATTEEQEQPTKWLRFLFLRAARFNHSCQPNVWFRTAPKDQDGGDGGGGDGGGAWIQMRVVRPVAAGEELFIDYTGGEPLLRHDRLHLLRSRWGFECQCPVCDDSDPSYDSAAHERKVTELRNLLAADGRADDADKCSEDFYFAKAKVELNGLDRLHEEFDRANQRASLYVEFGMLQHLYYENMRRTAIMRGLYAHTKEKEYLWASTDIRQDNEALQRDFGVESY